MSSVLAELLFKTYRRRALALMLLRPDQAYHVHEIARLTGTIPGTLHRELSKLAKTGVLSKSHRGNQVIYQANPNCVIYGELASILRKTCGIADVLADLLTPVSDHINLAAIFGSVASGKATQESDIDLLLVGDISFSRAVKLLYPAQDILGREINPKLYTAKEWCAAKKTGSVFVRQILTQPLITVMGDKDIAGKPAWN